MSQSQPKKFSDIFGPQALLNASFAFTDSGITYRLEHAGRLEHNMVFSLAHDIYGDGEDRSALAMTARSWVYDLADRCELRVREVADIMLDVVPSGASEYWYYRRGPGAPHIQSIMLMSPAKDCRIKIYTTGPLGSQPRDELEVEEEFALEPNQWVTIPNTQYWSITADPEMFASILTAYWTSDPLTGE